MAVEIFVAGGLVAWQVLPGQTLRSRMTGRCSPRVRPVAAVQVLPAAT
jgi:hypothetical protein